MTDREATQRFTVFSILVDHCGQLLTPDLLDKISDEMVNEMRVGPTAWAFRPYQLAPPPPNKGKTRGAHKSNT